MAFKEKKSYNRAIVRKVVICFGLIFLIGLIIFLLDGEFFGFATKDKIAFLWKYPLLGKYRHVSLSGDGSNICISIDTEDYSKPDDRLFFLNDKGKLLWKKRTSGRAWGEVSKDGGYVLSLVLENIIGPFSDNVHYFYNNRGKLLWKKEDERSFSFSENGKFIFLHFTPWTESGPSLVSIYNLDGSLHWEYDVKMEIAYAKMSNDGNYFVVLGPVEGRDIRVFLYSKKDGLIWDSLVSNDITPGDSVDISEDSRHVICALVRFRNEDLYLFDISGKLLWKGSALKKRLPRIRGARFISKDIIEIVTKGPTEWGKKYHVDLKGKYWEPKIIQKDTIANEYLKKTGDKPYNIVISSDGKSGVVVSADKKTITYFKIRK